MRKATAGVLIAALTLITLTACAPQSTETCDPTVPSSDIASAIQVTGVFDGTPSIQTGTPLVVSSESVAEVSEGNGALVRSGDIVTGTATLYDGATASYQDHAQLTRYTTSTDQPFFGAATCARVGSRITIVGPASSMFQTEDTETVIIVFDIDADYVGRATGTPVAPQNGFPNISLAPDGTPGVSFTGETAPTSLKVETLIKGGGETVKDGDSLLVQYLGIDWATHDVFDSSWANSQAVTLSTDDMVAGLKQALVGATVGSQVVAIVPPSLGYGDSPPSGSTLTKDSTLLFVVDILGVLPATDVE